MNIHNRGFNFLVPIGRNLTQQEEKNDVCFHDTDFCQIISAQTFDVRQADEESEDSGSGRSGGAPSIAEDDGENESAQDLDASMEDLDEDHTADTDDIDEPGEGDTEEFEEPSNSDF
jgi:hypothetical protein